MRILTLSLVLFMTASFTPVRAETSLILSGLSYHYNRTCPTGYICQKWNEQNYGMGIKKGQWSIGTYKNSYAKQTYFIGFQQPVKFNMGYGAYLATGYWTPLLPLPYIYASLPVTRQLNIQLMQHGTIVSSVVLEYKL